MLGRDHVLLRSSVALPQLDYVALGHVHRHQILGRDPLVVYSGALERVDFGEEKDEKGFYVVDLDPSKPAGSRLRYFQFQPVNARALLTVSVEIQPGDPDPTATVVRAIGRHHVEGAVVRVRIRVPGALEGHLRDADIRQALEGAHYVAAVSKEVIEVTRARLGQPYSKSLNPREALKAYLEVKNVAKDRADLLMRRAEELFADAQPE
jgi:exonuclease SbcD